MRCEDELVVEFHPASGTFQAGQYQFEVVANGAPMTCTVTIAGDLPSGTCSPASISLVGSLRCEGEACRASPVQTHQVYQMVIRGNPTPISVTASRDGSVLVQKTANPTYEVCGCEPNGHFGSTSLTVD
jgi:hypothetical protein